MAELTQITDERTFELTSAGMVAEIEMRAAIASGDCAAMSAWVRRGGEVRAHLRALHNAAGEADDAGRGDDALYETARSVLTGLAGTFSTLVTRHSSAVLRS
ncbi:MAG: hypothetical protein K1X95_05255 [Acidimicrobiia bacterium]|nr:hypothetical protein [Acidimicrobiia bacterium]